MNISKKLLASALLIIAYLYFAPSVHASVVKVRYVIKIHTTHPVSHSSPTQSHTASSPNSCSTARGLAGCTKFISDALYYVPDGNEWHTINQYTHKQLIAFIYRHESTYGSHDACRALGGYNGFGFAEPDSKLANEGPTCYPSFEAVVSAVNDWIDEKLHQGLSYLQVGCLYVTGYAIENCQAGYKFIPQS